jgi:D-alanyl-lipoteichoic acid acyltransferase DltB (MBOAT superfamily)
MSLTGWLTEYVFMPINVALRDWGKLGMILAVMANLFLVGIWHGANWTYAAFGLYHGLLFIPLVLSGAFQKKQKMQFVAGYIPRYNMLLQMCGTYLLVSMGLILFKAPTIEMAGQYFIHLFTAPLLFSVPSCGLITLVICFILLLLEWFAFTRKNMEYAVQRTSYGLSTLCLDLLMVYVIFVFSCDSNAEFIYFQF